MMAGEKFTWNVGIVEEDGKKWVALQFGLGDDPPTVDLAPDYARRIAVALIKCANNVDMDVG